MKTGISAMQIGFPFVAQTHGQDARVTGMILVACSRND
jgi:hypothetical protein